MIEGGLKSLDLAAFLFFNSLHLSWLNPIMTFFSGKAVWAPLVALTVWGAFKTHSRRNFVVFVLFLLLAIIASDVTSSYVLKNIFNRLRPCREENLLPLIYSFGQKCGGKFGFVSSHAANSFALVTYSLKTSGHKGKWWHLIWAMPAIVSYSRIYLGVHYPGDILGGAAVGLLWGYLLAFAFRNSRI